MKVFVKSLFAVFISMLTLMASLLMPSPAVALTSLADLPVHTLAAMSGKAQAASKKTGDDLQSAYGSVMGDSGQKTKGDDEELQADGTKVDAIVMDEVEKDAKRVEDATS